MEYLSNNRGRNCSDKGSTHKLSIKKFKVKVKVIFEIYLEPGGFIL